MPRTRCHPKFCEVSPQILRGVTPNFVRCHPKFCEVSPQILRGVTPNFARCHPKFCDVSPQILRGVTPNFARCHPKFCEVSPQKMLGVTPTTARSHPVSGGMAPHQFFLNNSISDVIKLRVLTVHEGHMGHYQHWRTEDSTSSCFFAILNVGKMLGVTPTDARWTKLLSLASRYSYNLLAKIHLQLQVRPTVLKSLAITVTSSSIFS